jgi:cytochrome oxidase Cu insertion factor (SCO1/SenC/PrrC family)
VSDQLRTNLPSVEAAPSGARTTTDSAIPFFLAFVLLLGMAYGGWTLWKWHQYEQSRGDAIPANAIGPPLTEFELTERSGKKFSSRDMRGRVWVASYFFTTCPGQCLRLNQNIAVQQAKSDLKDVTWVSITCDPDTDTLPALQEYANRFHADPERWLFCRADLDYIQRVAAGMKVYLSRKGHQDYAIVIDKSGKIRGMFDATSESQCIRLHDKLRECLTEDPPSDLATTAGGEKKSS